MLDREGRVVFGSFLMFVLAITGATVVGSRFDVALGDWPLVSLLLFAGVAVALPQLYLARIGAAATPRSRVRVAAVATASFAVAFAADAEGVRHLLLAAVGTGALLSAFCYEGLAGYRDVGGELTFDLGDR
ncbi:hypothetical protein [Natrinema salifodinae]|uniref:Uncharacterized protein n=1 Tax=Natrinema salifodinae TaxID=1202768 RepID=A0A1I0Q3A9_9EURY|nr:hypothetical protein [Natrinema salifodinae]SEW21280.1 hypothetical protein SAMN05216285_3003 [Natrinema salifodinae]